MDGFTSFLDTLDSFVWGPFLLIPLLLGTGIYLTIRLQGIQFTRLGGALRLAFGDRSENGSEGDISNYQALTTALAATVGVGNIAGVATAIYAGGPGAVFWMWVTALFGMATKYSEAFMGVRFRTTDARGKISGGPQYYLEKAIPGKGGMFLAISFAIFAVIASFGIGNMVQSNTVAAVLDDQWGVSTTLTGILLALITGLVLLGGIKAIGRVTAGVVPAMILVYLLAGIVILILNIGGLPSALGLIFTDAFTGTSAAGGFLGATVAAAIRFGVARGIFSNESGLGTAAIAAAAAQTRHPVRQGLVSMTQTFIDTIIVVTMTALVILSTGAWQSGEEGAAMTAEAFSSGLPGSWGGAIVAIAVVFFAGSTILGWSYYGERCSERLFGVKSIMVYRVIFVLFVFVGATTELSTVWTFSDLANGLMALPNLIGLIVCAGLIARETRAYFRLDPDLRHAPAQTTLHGTQELESSAS